MGYRIEQKPLTHGAERTPPALDNRRREARTEIPVGPVGARIVGGVDVKVCNLSRRGLLFESPLRLLVGAPAVLRVRGTDTWVELRGRVVRCCVSASLKGRLRYETAVELDADSPIAELTSLMGTTCAGSEVTLLDPDEPFYLDTSMH
jgi:hypothetical protein